MPPKRTGSIAKTGSRAHSNECRRYGAIFSQPLRVSRDWEDNRSWSSASVSSEADKEKS